MKKIYYLSILLLLQLGCKQGKEPTVTFTTPGGDGIIPTDSAFEVALEISPAVKADSVQFYLDSGRIAETKLPGTEISVLSGFRIPASGLKCGDYLLTAKVFVKGKLLEGATAVTLVPAKAPVKYSYQQIAAYPHDTSSYTQGLEYRDGILYESDGLRGESSLRKVDLKTGKVLQKVDIEAKYFAEGLSVLNDKILQLTWQENVGFIYDKKTLKKTGEFNYQNSREGWGLCFDGSKLIKSDGSNKLYFLNKDTYAEAGFISVYNNKEPVENLNELEFIDGKIYANVYGSDVIVIVNPASGAVEGELDLGNIYPGRPQNDDLVLNGIAWDKQERRMFVTGKKWDKLFEIKVNPGQ